MTALTEGALLRYLQNYVSALEVQFMIDESLKKFAAANANASNSSSSSGGGGNGGGGPSPPPAAGRREADAAWLETLVRSQVEEDIRQQLPAMVREEVERQLRAKSAARPPIPPSPSSSSPPPLPPQQQKQRESVAPPPPSSAAVGSEEGAPDSADTEEDEEVSGRRQRQQILAAVRDVEHHLSALQRSLNDVAHAQRQAQRRAEGLCAALQGDGPESLADTLAKALDAGDAVSVRDAVARALSPLLLLPSASGATTPLPCYSAPFTPPRAGGPGGEGSRSANSSVLVSTNAAMAAAARPLHRLYSAHSVSSIDPTAATAAAETATTVPAVSLGINAVDVPAGALPASVALHGAVRVLGVQPGGAGERTGMQVGDVLLSAEGFGVVEGCDQLRAALAAGAGELRVYRQLDGSVRTLALRL